VDEQIQATQSNAAIPTVANMFHLTATFGSSELVYLSEKSFSRVIAVDDVPGTEDIDSDIPKSITWRVLAKFFSRLLGFNGIIIGDIRREW
jgi:hypothetical protein